MIRPLFTEGQKVVCVDTGTVSRTGKPSDLIEGKSYIVKDPEFLEHGNRLYIRLQGRPSTHVYNQYLFVSVDEDRAMDEQIRQALNRRLLIEY